MHAVKGFLGVNCTVCSMAGYWKSASKVKQTLIYICNVVGSVVVTVMSVVACC